MLWNEVYSNFIEIKIRCVGDTPNRVTNPQHDGVTDVTVAYCYRLFFRVSWESFFLCVVIVERQ